MTNLSNIQFALCVFLDSPEKYNRAELTVHLVQTSVDTLFIPPFAFSTHSTDNSNGEQTLSQCYKETCLAEGCVPHFLPLSRLQHLIHCMSGRLRQTCCKPLFSPKKWVSGLARCPDWGREAGFSSSKVTVALPAHVGNGVGHATGARSLC